MLSTMRSDLDTCRRKAKVSGAWEVVDFPRPGVIALYNKGEGGTDLNVIVPSSEEAEQGADYRIRLHTNSAQLLYKFMRPL
jgi:hypothetical protein